MTAPLPDDTRGIIDPAGMLRHVDFARSPAGAGLDGLVEWFWSVAWDLPAGLMHDQQVLNHPAGNISIGTIDDDGVLDPPQGRIYGVLTGLSSRQLSGNGWTVAARLSVGALGVFLDAPARTATNAQLSLVDGIPGFDGRAVVAGVCAEADNPARIAVLQMGLEQLVATRDPALVAEAREVSRVAAIAEHDRAVCRDDQLAEAAGTSVRTLQRLFDAHVGVSPSTVVRRWRIIEAAEAARDAAGNGKHWRGWAAVAAELGYSDQAHLTRDFRRHLGTSPAVYLAKASGHGG